MSALTDLHDELSGCMARIEKLCRQYNYDAKPTLVLRHKDGSSYSIVIGNDDLQKVIQVITDLNGPEVQL